MTIGIEGYSRDQREALMEMSKDPHDCSVAFKDACDAMIKGGFTDESWHQLLWVCPPRFNEMCDAALLRHKACPPKPDGYANDGKAVYSSQCWANFLGITVEEYVERMTRYVDVLPDMIIPESEVHKVQ